MLKINQKSTEQLAYFFMLTPFISILPMASDLQPIYLIFIVLFFIFKYLDEFELKLPMKNISGIVLIIFLGMVFFINKYVSGILNVATIIITLLFFANSNHPEPNTIKKAILFLFISAVLNILMPGVWNIIAELIMFDYRGDSAGRGVAGIAPEAGIFGALNIIIFVIIDLIYKKKIDLKYKIFLCFNIVASLSATGLFTFVAYLILNGAYKLEISKVILYSFILSLTIFIFTYVFPESRFSSLFIKSLENPAHVFLADVSFIMRYIPILIGLYSIFNGNLFGVDGDFTLSFLQNNNHVLDAFARFNNAGGGSSALGLILINGGVFGALFFLYTLLNISYAKRLKISVLFVFSVFFMFSLSFSFPLLWFIYYLGVYNNEKNYICCQ
ncbi:MAG: hypothetical protein VX185_09635 [Pseudomonadota bacterium]|nr:hypothetical protein [Pseudomonadota bacterium]